eukprot:TRINITY_DN27679_c0_g2_i1.p1 TRINITY_DN27679_c0_g2~~TRINITY_DN27679_c0_g2_i1.p1  ORF type:complete len:466 (-),score=78.91 TRINITY_DN27679_c0_g2_i1:19-1416(-)
MPPDTPHGSSCAASAASPAVGARPTLPAEGLASQLICRVRPCDKPSPLVSVLERQARVEVCPEKGHPGEPLRFDKVLGSRGSAEQEDLFEIVRPAVLSCFQGNSCTVVAYGGPQSGKSYTLSGFFMTGHLHGLAPRAIQMIVETIDASVEIAPVVEASFFEIQQDNVCDLLPRTCPKVSMKESSQPPYVVMDPNLTAHRCDAGGAGHNRLLDTYFTGLEHRRKGAHTCFQITFVQPNGHRSLLRFVEIAWPRPQAPGTSQTGNAAGGRPGPSQASSNLQPPGSAQGRVGVALDQVVQCKLTGLTPVPYRSSPVSLLLKPCFEGNALLYFVYCLRLEQIQLPCLAHAAPLLAKLHLWLGRTRNSNVPSNPTTAVSTSTSAARPGSQPVVPPLRLRNAGSGVVEPVPIVVDDPCSPGTSSASGCSPESSGALGHMGKLPSSPMNLEGRDEQQQLLHMQQQHEQQQHQ